MANSQPSTDTAHSSSAVTSAAHQAVVRQYDLLDDLPEAPFERVVKLAAALFEVPFAALSLSARTSQHFKACVGIDLDEKEHPVAMRRHVMETESPLTVRDASTHESFADAPIVTGPPHVRFFAGVPVQVEGSVLGVLFIMDTEPQDPPSAAMRQLEVLANIAADELVSQRKDRDRERMEHLHAYHHEVLQQIATDTPLPEILENISLLAEAHSPAAQAGIMLYDQGEQMLRHAVAPTLPAAYTEAIGSVTVEPESGTCGAAAHDKSRVITQDIASDPRWVDYRDVALHHDLRSCWSTPIFDQKEQVLGTLALYHEDRRVPASADKEVMDAVAQLARAAITHHRERERLRSEQERLQTTLQSSDLSGWVYNFNDRVYTVDTQWARMMGYDPDEIEPTLDFFLQHVHPHDQVLFHTALNAHVKGKRAATDVTLRMKTRSGRWRTVLVRGKVMAWNADGSPRRAVGTHMDITDTSRAKEALQEHKEILQAVFDHVPAMIAFYTTQGALNMVNRQWKQVLGWSMQDAQQHPDILHALFPEKNRRLQARSFLDKAPDAWKDIPVHAKDGTVVDTSWTVVATTPDHRVAIGIDISERARYQQELIEAKEQAEEMSRLKSALLANMSHEIRTPLTSIIGFSEVLLNETLPPPADRFVQMVHTSGERLMRTLNSVLSLSQLEAGSIEVNPEAYDLARQLRELHAMFVERADAEDIACKLQGAADHVPVVLDESAVQRIVSNLMSNAIKFTEAGGIVELTLTPADTEVVIAVRDTGVGIDAEFMDRLFAPFRQESTGHQREYEGSGLGLAITHELVGLLRGSIDVESEKGKGSRFIVRLPRDMHALAAGNE